MYGIDFEKLSKFHSPGYVIEVYKDGKNEEFVYGNKAVTPIVEKATKKTLYDIASLTKLFTATLVYMAREENLMDLNNSIYSFDDNFIKLKEVKIIDLLSHNQNIWTQGYLGSAKNMEEFYNILNSAYVKENTPTYVDTHYIILSTVLERVYGKSFAEICKEKIFDKLSLKDTTFDPDPNRCASNNYERTEGSVVVNDVYPGVVHDKKARVAKKLGLNLGHASIFTTGRDLLKFAQTFLTNTLLKRETIEFMMGHRNTNETNYLALKKLLNGDDVNEMYEEALKRDLKILLPETYNNMGVRYRNKINKMNDVPNKASDKSISFNGYTGPMVTIDFENKIVVVIMCNLVHNSALKRKERRSITIDMMNTIFNSIL